MPLTIGFIGAGANTRERHIPGFRAMRDVALMAVANRSLESGRRVAAEFSIPKVYEHAEELIADPEVNAVCIGTWPYMHREYTIRALEAGKHVLCEARMAANLAEAEEMLEASERHPGLVAQIVPAPFDLRLGPTITRLISQGALGEVREVAVTSANGSGLDPATPIHWRQQQQYSGRNIMTLGIWAEVIQRWLGEARTVTADGSIYVHQRPEGGAGIAQVDVPDAFTATGELANGARYTYRISSVAAGAADNGVTVHGTKATVRWLPNGSATWAEHGTPFEDLPPDPGSDHGWQVEADFVASVQTGAPVRLTNFRDGVRYMRFVDAAWRSWQEGRRLEL